MSKEKDGKKKSDKTPPSKSIKEKREFKINPIQMLIKALL